MQFENSGFPQSFRYLFGMEDDVVPEKFWCPRCGGLLKEKRPKDKHIVRNEKSTVRFFCPCGYYRDEIISSESP